MEAAQISALLYDGSRCPLCGDPFEVGEEFVEVMALVQFPVQRKGDAVRVRTHVDCREMEATH